MGISAFAEHWMKFKSEIEDWNTERGYNIIMNIIHCSMNPEMWLLLRVARFHVFQIQSMFPNPCFTNPASPYFANEIQSMFYNMAVNPILIGVRFCPRRL